VEALANRIKNDFPGIQTASHVGDTYADPGDVKLNLDTGGVVYLELKFVSQGKGTRANIGQDSLTDYQLFEPDTVSWSRFRRMNNHEKWVMGLLDRFTKYPSHCKRGTLKLIMEMKASYLKKEVLGIKTGNIGPIIKKTLSSILAGEDEKLAAEIIDEIMRRDREEKIRYIEYLRSRRQNPDNIKKFTFLILAGAHTHKAMNRMWSLPLDKIIDMLRTGAYYVYYVEKKTLSVYREDLSRKLAVLMDKTLKIYFNEGQTNVIIGYEDGERLVKILRIVFHWKNIFQGIKTPCLNVFDEAFLYDP
jgi:hypothetical protein